MKLKISEISKQSGVPSSTIRYYVREGLLPPPEKVNKKMAYYEDACIERLKAIQCLQGKRYYPLLIIKNILRRMDEGLSLQEAESVGNAVFGTEDRVGLGLLDRAAVLAQTGLTEDELGLAESLGIFIPMIHEGEKLLYDEDDVRVGRDSLRKLIDYGVDLRDMDFFVELGQKIVEKELALRRKLVSDKSMKENIRITTEISRPADIYRDYVLRRLFQRQVQENIRRSLGKKKRE